MPISLIPLNHIILDQDHAEAIKVFVNQGQDLLVVTNSPAFIQEVQIDLVDCKLVCLDAGNGTYVKTLEYKQALQVLERCTTEILDQVGPRVFRQLETLVSYMEFAANGEFMNGPEARSLVKNYNEEALFNHEG